MDEELKFALLQIAMRLNTIEEEMRRYRQLQESKESLVPKFVESSPKARTYGQMIENFVCPRRGYLPRFQGNDFIYIMGYFDQEMLDKLTPIATQVKILSPIKTPLSARNKDALTRMKEAGAEVKVHPMLHARIFCVPTRNFLIIGSGDIQTDCFGGTRFDAGIWSNYPDLIKDAMNFFNKVWAESETFPTQ